MSQSSLNHRAACLLRVIILSAVTVGFGMSSLRPVAAQSDGVTYESPLAYVGADGRYYVTSLDGTSTTAVTSKAAIQVDKDYAYNLYTTSQTGVQTKAVTTQTVNELERQYWDIPNSYDSLPYWSLAGSQFAFIDEDSTIYLAASGKSPEKLDAPTTYSTMLDPVLGRSLAASDTLARLNYVNGCCAIALDKVLAWSPDGQQIAYLSGDFDVAKGKIRIIQPSSNETREIPIPPYPGGCDGVGPGPERAWQSVGEDRDKDYLLYSTFSLIWTNQGFFLNNPCLVLPNTLISASGAVLWQSRDTDDDIVLSPDRRHVFGTSKAYFDNPLPPSMIDLVTGAQTPLSIGTGSEPLAWTNDDKSIIFATKTLYKKIDPDQKEPRTVFNEQEHDDYILTLWQQGLDKKRPTKLFQHEGYNFGTVTVAPDDSAVVFSLISNTVFDKVDPEVQIVAVPMNGGPANWIAIGGKPAFGSNPFTAIPADTTSNVLPEVNCPKSLISRLKVGQRGKVTPGVPNSLRTLPVGGTQLRDLLAGSPFLVLEGPTCGSDGLAWWRVNYHGTVGWTPESDSKEYWLEP